MAAPPATGIRNEPTDRPCWSGGDDHRAGETVVHALTVRVARPSDEADDHDQPGVRAEAGDVEHQRHRDDRAEAADGAAPPERRAVLVHGAHVLYSLAERLTAARGRHDEE